MLETSFDDRLDAEIREILVSHICVICNQGQEMKVSDALGTYRQSMYQLHCQSILVEWYHLSLKRDLYPDDDQRAQ